MKPEEFDVFHELIAIDEVARCGSGGVLWGLFAGLSIGLPPVIQFASKYLQDKVQTNQTKTKQHRTLMGVILGL